MCCLQSARPTRCDSAWSKVTLWCHAPVCMLLWICGHFFQGGALLYPWFALMMIEAKPASPTKPCVQTLQFSDHCLPFFVCLLISFFGTRRSELGTSFFSLHVHEGLNQMMSCKRVHFWAQVHPIYFMKMRRVWWLIYGWAASTSLMWIRRRQRWPLPA